MMADLFSTLAPFVANAFIAMAFSMFLWKKNIFSDIAQETFIATALAMYFVAAVKQIQASGITPLMNGKVILIIPLIFGLLIFTQFKKEYSFMMRWSLAIVIGVGFGIIIRTSIESTVMANFVGSILPLTGLNALDLFNNILMMVAVFSTLSYFIFTRPRVGVTGQVQKVGRYFMMVYFGAGFGQFVMARLSVFLGVLSTFLRNFGIIA